MHALHTALYRTFRPRSAEQLRPLFERLVFTLGMLNPLTAVPQLYQIFGTQSVGGLSLFTVGAALLMSVLWTAYGAVSRQPALWATNSVWIGMNGATVAGVIAYS